MTNPDFFEAQKQFLARLAEDCSAEQLVIPSFPDVTLRIRNLADAPDTSIEQIVAALSVEPVLAAQVLRLANSVLYRGAGQAETSLARAVQRLGMAEVRDMAVMFGMRQLSLAASVAAYRDYLREVWEHSLVVAQLSRLVATRARMANAGSAQLAGLLHDLGKFYIVMRAQDYPDLLGLNHSIAMIASDWHCAVGRAILESWELPLQIQQAAEEHEMLDRDPIRQLPDLADVVGLANAAANLTPQAEDPEFEALLETATGQRLNLDAAALREATEEARQAANTAREAFPPM
jgi:putative nucleotidyltransferase with HDIG domain